MILSKELHSHLQAHSSTITRINVLLTARPVPPWVLTIQVDPNIDTGITGSSDGFTITSHNTLFRHRKGGWEADGAKWGARKYM